MHLVDYFFPGFKDLIDSCVSQHCGNFVDLIERPSLTNLDCYLDVFFLLRCDHDVVRSPQVRYGNERQLDAAVPLGSAASLPVHGGDRLVGWLVRLTVHGRLASR